MEFKVYLYIAGAVLYYGYQYWKKRQEAKNPPASTVLYDEKEEEEEVAKSPSSLDEMFREFNIPSPEKKQEEVLTYETKEVVDNYDRKEENVPAYKSYENAAVPAQVTTTYSQKYNNVTFKEELNPSKFEPFKETKKKKNQFAELLQNKKGLKKALIISEIMNRKY